LEGQGREGDKKGERRAERETEGKREKAREGGERERKERSVGGREKIGMGARPKIIFLGATKIPLALIPIFGTSSRTSPDTKNMSASK
jgi:hypothetical protein